jgi:hypothetical protein
MAEDNGGKVEPFNKSLLRLRTGGTTASASVKRATGGSGVQHSKTKSFSMSRTAIAAPRSRYGSQATGRPVAFGQRRPAVASLVPPAIWTSRRSRSGSSLRAAGLAV